MIFLEAGEYIVSVLGGFGVEINSFEIELLEPRQEVVLRCHKLRWKYQHYYEGRRAKRLYKFNVSDAGNYKLRFIHADTLEVRRSNLPISSLFQNPIPNQHIEILIDYNWNE
jgi:hypothetical protein